MSAEPVEIQLAVNRIGQLMQRILGNMPRAELSPAALARTVGELRLDPRYVKVHGLGHHHRVLGSLRGKVAAVDDALVVTDANLESCNDFGLSQRKRALGLGPPRPLLSFGYKVTDPASAAGHADARDLAGDRRVRTVLGRPGTITPGEVPPPLPNGVGIAVLTRRADELPGPYQRASPLEAGSVSLLQHARGSIDWMTPNLSDPEIIWELVEAMVGGAKLRLLLPLAFNACRQRLPFQGGDNWQTALELAYLRAIRGSDPGLLEGRWYRDEHWAIAAGLAATSHARFEVIAVDRAIAPAEREWTLGVGRLPGPSRARRSATATPPDHLSPAARGVSCGLEVKPTRSSGTSVDHVGRCRQLRLLLREQSELPQFERGPHSGDSTCSSHNWDWGSLEPLESRRDVGRCDDRRL